MREICVQGLGFVGAAMAVATADVVTKEGQPLYSVIGVDRHGQESERRITSINHGEFPFKCGDPCLAEATKRAHSRGNLSATTDEGVYSSAAIIIVDINLDIDPREEMPRVALSGFADALRSVFSRAKEGCLVLIETTVPPGTCENIVVPIKHQELEKRGLAKDAVLLAHSYERVMPGKSYLDSIKNYWRVFSGETPGAAQVCEDFLRSVINTNEYPLTELKSMTASETAKVMENTYRAVNIAFIDEWTKYAESVGIDIFEVIDAIRSRPTHSNIMSPGLGVGGYCLTKDPAFTPAAMRQIFTGGKDSFPFSQLAMKTNAEMPDHTVDRLKQLLEDDLRKKKILILGATYRANVADTRYTPVQSLVESLEEFESVVSVYDPLIQTWSEMNRDTLSEFPTAEAYDAVVFAVAHDEFSSIDFEHWLIGGSTVILDACNLLSETERERYRELGNVVESIGRGPGL